MSHRLSRRNFLATLGATGALLPLVGPDLLRADSGRAPARFVTITMPNGFAEDYFYPTGTANDWTINPADDSILKPLIPHKEDVIVMGGVSIQNGIDTVRDELGKGFGGHAAGPFMLTGARGLPGPEISDSVTFSSGHASIDQHLAQNLPGNDELPYRSLVMRPFRLSGNDQFVSFAGPSRSLTTPNVPAHRDDLSELYVELFGGTDNAETVARLRAERRSVLDLTHRQLGRFAREVETTDRYRIEQHMEATREIERQLDTLTGTCVAPDQPDPTLDYRQPLGNPHLDLITKTQIDVATSAFACDLTRIVTLSWSNSRNNEYTFPFLADKEPSFAERIPSDEPFSGVDPGGLRNHHSIAHAEGRNTRETTARKRYVDQWFVGKLAYLLDKLKETRDANGQRLIENTVVLFANHQRVGRPHMTTDIPWILAGNVDGYFRTGRFLRYVNGRGRSGPQNGILTAIVNAMGLEQEYFGSEEYGGAYSSLLA